ncbi:uncharacterized protein LOC107607522 [Arachis ipaensis]|uniref:uncharacterized protein LOC107607522 n=1 Tax=Arachis ipaensis TaxID=130454 RepID=UPI0007AFDC62|nr:uncharacterized protein LOC107607522 [Arachis ipaensis]
MNNNLGGFFFIYDYGGTDSICSIKQGSPLAKLICKAKLIIWNEAPMLNKICYEVLDKSFKDILRSSSSYNEDLPFAGKVVVLGGDFRQIIPVINMGSRKDIVQAIVNSSYLWSSIGDGLEGDSIDGEFEVNIPEEILIKDSADGFDNIIKFERTILALTLDIVHGVNNYIIKYIESDEKVYLSSDSMCVEKGSMESELNTFTLNVLNAINCLELSPHELILKVGVPVMLLKNID